MCLFLYRRSTAAAAEVAQNVQSANFLNHLYLVVDGKTFRSLTESEFLEREFAICEKRTTKNKSNQWTGFYLYGLRTYLEFLEAAPSLPFPIGAIGIGLGLDAASEF